MAVNYASLAVGDEISIKVSGTAQTFIVVNQGKPSDVYDDSCDGTWVMAKSGLFNQAIHSSNNNYGASTLHTYLNNTWLNTLDASVIASIKEVRIPYTNGTGTAGSVATGASGLKTKVFIPSLREVYQSNLSYSNVEGATWSYYTGGGKVGFATSDNYWWLRSPDTGDATDYWCIGEGGRYRKKGYNSYLVRPVFVLGAPSGPNGKVNVGGAWKDMSAMKVNVGGVWKDVSKIYTNVGGVWKE